jgi:DNA polymerase/3'-5' exonuclease PolX
MYSLRTRIKTIIIFDKIIDVLNYIGDVYRAKYYRIARNQIDNNDLNSLSDTFKKKIKYIDKMPNKDYLEYPELMKLLKIKKISNVYGIGLAMLKTMSNDKRSVEDFIKGNMDKFTDTQKKGLKYWQRLSTNVSRDIVTKVYGKIEGILEKYKDVFDIDKIDIVGSYRREKEDNLGDIDILVLSQSAKASDILEVLKRRLKGMYATVLTSGNKKTTFLVKVPKFNENIFDRRGRKNNNVIYKREDVIPDDYKEIRLKGVGKNNYIQVDLMVIDRKSYPYALLYFTGSKLFNIMMRKKANTMGYTLNEYGIRELDKDEYLFDFTKESQIIKFFQLDFKYIEPKNRYVQ